MKPEIRPLSESHRIDTAANKNPCTSTLECSVHQVTTQKYDIRCMRANMQSASLGLI